MEIEWVNHIKFEGFDGSGMNGAEVSMLITDARIEIGRETGAGASGRDSNILEHSSIGEREDS